MYKVVNGIVLVVVGMFASISSAEEFVLRMEHGIFKMVERHGVEQDSNSDRIELAKSKGVIKQVLEVQVKTAERFYSKAKVGDTAIEIRGELKAPDGNGQIILKVRASVTKFTGQLIEQPDGMQVELTSKVRSESMFPITVGKPKWICDVCTSSEPQGVAPPALELDHQILFVTLEPVKNDD